MENKKLTAANGRPVADNQNIQTVGPAWTSVITRSVVYWRNWPISTAKLFPKDVCMPKVPEHSVHFTVTHDITKYTKAAIFSEVGKKTECFVRFSTVAGERGAADAERDIRGFAMKFYTEEGNWDLVGNNTPVFFLA